MLKKGTTLYSILTGSCPKCHEESMYKAKNPYYLSKLFEMNEKCSHCNLRYKIEPSFFYGAMYVSYALNVAVGIATFIVTKMIFGLDLVDSFIAILIILFLLTPVTIRLARNIYINIFVHYDKNALKK